MPVASTTSSVPGSGKSGESADQVEPEARPSRRRGGAKKKGGFFRELIILIVAALVLTFFIQTFLGRVFVIPSGSMEQTLIGGDCATCSNDRVLVDKITYDFSKPRPGDVVVFKGPDTWQDSDFGGTRSSNPVVSFLQDIGSLFGLAAPDERDFVKRVIAVGGQTVQCCDAQNHILVDGKPLTEPFVYWEPNLGPPHNSAFDPVTVPVGKLWVMGDNRNNSSDSRFQGRDHGGVSGTVPVANVIGKVRVIVLPVSRWGGVSDFNPQTAGK